MSSLEKLRTAMENNPEFKIRIANFELLALAGHGVNLDIVLDSKSEIESVRVHHVLTCTQCVKDRNERT